MKRHVILCCHNGEAYIRQQLLSILGQTRRVHQIHVFDFASRDRTVAIVEATAREQDEISVHCLHYDDAPGASISFFRALAQLSGIVEPGDQIFLSDQDDVWDKTKVDKVDAVFSEHWAHAPEGRLLVFHDVKIVDESLEVIRPSFYSGGQYSLPRDLVPERLLLANPVIGHTMTLSGALLKFVSANVTPQAYVMHDWAIALFANRFGRIAFVPEAISSYRQHSNNILGTGKKRSAIAMMEKGNRLADEVVRQLKAFLDDCARIWKHAPDLVPSAIDVRLGAHFHSSYASRQLALAVLALRTGPTIARRGLSAFFLLGFLKNLFRIGLRNDTQG